MQKGDWSGRRRDQTQIWAMGVSKVGMMEKEMGWEIGRWEERIRWWVRADATVGEDFNMGGQASWGCFVVGFFRGMGHLTI